MLTSSIDVIDLSKIGKPSHKLKPTLADEFQSMKPGVLTYYEYDPKRRTSFSRWLSVTRARTGQNVRFTKVAVDRLATSPADVRGEDGIVIFDYEGYPKPVYFTVKDGQPEIARQADLPKLPKGTYFLWISFPKVEETETVETTEGIESSEGGCQ